MIYILEALLAIFGVWVFKAVTTLLAVSGCDKCCCLLLRWSVLTQIGISCCQVLQEEGIFSLIVIQEHIEEFVAKVLLMTVCYSVLRIICLHYACIEMIEWKASGEEGEELQKTLKEQSTCKFEKKGKKWNA